jgi:hypothetical protein
LSILKLLAKNTQRTIGPTDERGLLLDAVLRESVTHTSKVTAYPIEKGADISDHIIIEPTSYTMTGSVSDSPMRWKATEYNHTDASTRNLSAYAILRDLHLSRTVFDIEHGFLEMKDCVMVSFISEKDASTANVFRFDATVRQLNIVKTIEVSVTADMVAIGEQAEQAQAEEDLAAQAPPPVDEGSALMSGIKAVAGGLGF